MNPDALTITAGDTDTSHIENYIGGYQYSVASDDEAIATASVSGSVVTVEGVAAGNATITVTASNGVSSADATISVTVS